MRFLQRRGVIGGDPGPEPVPCCEATPLEGMEWLTAPAAGVVVVPSSVFAAGRSAVADGIRISIGAAASRATLAEGLGRLAAL